MKLLLTIATVLALAVPAVAGEGDPKVGDRVYYPPNDPTVICDTLDQIRAIASATGADRAAVFEGFASQSNERGEPICDFGPADFAIQEVVPLGDEPILGVPMHIWAVRGGDFSMWSLHATPVTGNGGIVPQSYEPGRGA